MKRFILFCAIVALLPLAATASFASNGRSGAVHGKSAQATHGNSGAAQAQAGIHGAATKADATTTARGKATTHGKAETHAQGGAAVDQPEGPGKSAEAQHHVILCHRTGSATNPYVVINVSVRAWEHGHTTHPAKDGRDDILLQDPAQPGEKMDESRCPAEAGGVSPGESGGGETGGQTGGQVSGGGVAGAQVAASVRTTSGGGVAGAAGAVANQPLPFTGMPLWIVFLTGLGLLTSGFVVRRLSRGTR
jgi:hypothetical protein